MKKYVTALFILGMLAAITLLTGCAKPPGEQPAIFDEITVTTTNATTGQVTTEKQYQLRPETAALIQQTGGFFGPKGDVAAGAIIAAIIAGLATRNAAAKKKPAKPPVA